MTQASIYLRFVDCSILALFIAFVIGIGFALQRHMKTSADFFLAAHFSRNK
ncbi:MAG: hypothetical protein K8R38_10300 [Verrucomicrobia bacterium]|nr:hypothetical protein [Verrucomicrobiota bacterium]